MAALLSGMLRVLNVALLGGVVALITFAVVTRNFAPLDLMLWLLIIGVVLLLFNVLVSAGMSPVAQEAAAVPAAERAGRLAVARLVGIRQTNTTVNDQPLCELDVAVAPEDRAAYRTSVRQVVQVIDLPKWEVGMPLVVIRFDMNAPGVRVLRDPPARWLEKAQAAPAVDAPVWQEPFGARKLLLGRMPFWLYPLAFVVGAGLSLLPYL